jgi:SAM-dependent methyltransferase
MGYGEAPSTTESERWLARGLAFLGPLREIAEHGVMWLPTTPGRLLDVGCGAGAFLERMRDFGWQIAGVEPDAKAREAAAARLGNQDTVVPSLAAEALAKESFDAITLSHVIEHVPDPVATLRDCARLLAPGGIIVCVTPNTTGLGTRTFGQSWIHWDPPRHLHLFDPTSLERAFSEAGLSVTRTATPGSTAHYVWQASTKIERSGRVPGGRPSGVSPALWLESLGFWAIEYVLTRFGRRCGEEVLVVGSKAAA